MSIVGKNPLLTILFALLLMGLCFAEPAAALRSLDRQLMAAVQKGDAQKVKTLIAKGANVKAKDDAGSTPLHLATRKDIADVLIAGGASVNEKNADFKMTPLFNVPTDVAAYLIINGSDVNMRARKGMTPLSRAVYWDQKDKV